MLFRQDVEPACAYCSYGCKLNDDEIACKKHGVVMSYSSCRRFRYDPLKRIPPRPIEINCDKYSQQDFSLD